MRTQVRGVNVAVTPITDGAWGGAKIAELRVGASYCFPGVERLDAGQVDELIGLLTRVQERSERVSKWMKCSNGDWMLTRPNGFPVFLTAREAQDLVIIMDQCSHQSATETKRQ